MAMLLQQLRARSGLLSLAAQQHLQGSLCMLQHPAYATAQPAESSNIGPDAAGADPWDFQEDAKRFVAAHRALKMGKPDRQEQLEAFITYKEAARAIAEKMSGGKINWVTEEARARSTVKRNIVRMVRDNEDWENHQERFRSPVTQQLWSDAIVEIEAEMGPRWSETVLHHSLADSQYRYKPR